MKQVHLRSLAGFVTTQPAKHSVLGVPEASLAQYGAVSEPVGAMLAGALKKSGADIGIAVSGIAGPGAAQR